MGKIGPAAAQGRMMRQAIIGVLLWMPVCLVARADTAAEFELRVLNTVDVFAECAAFYMISMVGAGNTPEADDLQTRSEAAYRAALGVVFSVVGAETTDAKLQLAAADLTKRMGGEFKNYSRLLVVYGGPCGQLIEGLALGYQAAAPE